MENENNASILHEDANNDIPKSDNNKPVTFGNPDKYGYDKIKPADLNKKQLEDEANAVVGSE